MRRPVTMYSGTWADLDFEELCKKLSSFGYDGIELACIPRHLDISKAAEDSAYTAGIISTLGRYGIQCHALNAQGIGQCIGDLWDPRINSLAPAEHAGNPEAIRSWAVEEMARIARVAAAMGCQVVVGNFGSPVWRFLYPYPPVPEKMIHDGYQMIHTLWSPVLDRFDEEGVRFALDIQPSGIAYDYYSFIRLLEVFGNRKTLGVNFNPANLIWQGIQPELFIADFPDRICHVHIKDAAVTLNGRTGILGSHLPMGDLKRGWNFRSPGHGDVDFEAVMRQLNAAGYSGPLSVYWEDAGMGREYGARDAADFTRQINFPPSGQPVG